VPKVKVQEAPGAPDLNQLAEEPAEDAMEVEGKGKEEEEGGGRGREEEEEEEDADSEEEEEGEGAAQLAGSSTPGEGQQQVLGLLRVAAVAGLAEGAPLAPGPRAPPGGPHGHHGGEQGQALVAAVLGALRSAVCKALGVPEGPQSPSGAVVRTLVAAQAVAAGHVLPGYAGLGQGTGGA